MTASPTESINSPLLSVRGLSRRFAGRGGAPPVWAVDDVSFDVNPGEVVALVGESGSGKSTVARLIARLLPPTAGQILWRGQNALAGRRAPAAFRADLQMIFQDPFAVLNPVHTVAHHLERPLRLHRKAGSSGGSLSAAVERLLDTVGLQPAAAMARKYPHQLSGGQRQRVGIARALAAGPSLVLADEPTSMLDVSIRMEILNLLLTLRRERGISYLYITHDLGSARAIADRLLVMQAGRIVESGATGTVLDSPSHPYTRQLLAAIPSFGTRRG